MTDRTEAEKRAARAAFRGGVIGGFLGPLVFVAVTSIWMWLA